MTKNVPFPASQSKGGVVGEQRDTERLITLWQQKVFKFGTPPPASTFDFSMMIAGGDCGFRFVICADPVAADHAFLIYGPQFARLLGLRQQPAPNLPIARQVPKRYLPLFTEGCIEAIVQGGPVRISGAVVHLFGQIELYRAAFMPLAGELKSASQLVFGTFNRRIGPKVCAADAFTQTENWVGYDIPSAHDPATVKN